MNANGILAVFLTVMCWCAFANAQEEDVAASPLDDIAQKMRASANQLAKKVTAKPTQQPQKEAVEKLDALIAKLEEERRMLQGMGQTTAQPKIPANQSMIMQGPGGMGDLKNARENGNRWGDLPPHERDRILQSLTEGFPPHYQAILEAYYKRLATEKPAEASEPLGKPQGATGKSGAPQPMSPKSTSVKSPAMKADK